ncbi:copper resistance CopC/CopD family protein [Peribacillus glennii]|uniref:CopC domain-containing protein n=1 Tax=Peribacillus glennii TaxID=2303991 RepID=A0A372L811_9BACI|nr:copper resistance protein CopC [Peribacillus glennii]RFU61440.1 hypothetical protein D0466_18330 [Peribacillus glennii]
MRGAFILFSVIFCTLIYPKQIFAHAVLTEAKPAADSRLQESPDLVTLSFNEKIKEGLYTIKVLNQSRETISDKKPQLSMDKRKLQISIPRLNDGAYLVTYQIVSADGHPISGSYVFTVGNAAFPLDPEWKTTGLEKIQIAVYLTRAVYYVALLGITGWIFWGVFQTTVQPEIIRKKYRFTALVLQQFHLLSLLILIAVQWLMNTTSSGIPLNTGFGLSWLFSLLLSLMGFWVLFRAKWLDTAWFLLMLAAKSFNGHSNAYGPEWVSIPLNFLHLLFAAVWAGGLLYIILYWQKHHLHVKEFILLFSKIAFLCMMFLFLTGTFAAFLFLPDISYLWAAPWGILLIIKLILVLFVILSAGKVRSIFKNKPAAAAWLWLKIDFSIMLMITFLVGGLSYLSPIPPNTPLKWVEKGSGADMTITITPNAPGKNKFQLQFKKDKVKRAELSLIYEGGEKIAPIVVPLKPSSMDGIYVAEGYYLPFHGKWVAKVTFIDKNEKEILYTKSFRIFSTRGNESK